MAVGFAASAKIFVAGMLKANSRSVVQKIRRYIVEDMVGSPFDMYGLKAQFGEITIHVKKYHSGRGLQLEEKKWISPEVMVSEH